MLRRAEGVGSYDAVSWRVALHRWRTQHVQRLQGLRHKRELCIRVCLDHPSAPEASRLRHFESGQNCRDSLHRCCALQPRDLCWQTDAEADVLPPGALPNQGAGPNVVHSLKDVPTILPPGFTIEVE